MAGTKHTAGNWEVSDTSIVAGDFCIAVTEDDGGYEAPAEERTANAHLIAAAPDLLAACQAAIEATGGSANWKGETEKFLKLCEAAIQKAQSP